MSLSSNQLDAFYALAQLNSFSKAAAQLYITQSALSQRILNLEEEVGTTLVIREPSGLRLTEIGQELLRYVQKKQALEEEFQSHLRGHSLVPGQLKGRIRIAAFSTVMHSVIFPALNSVVSSHPELMIDAVVAEVHALEALLQSGSVDFIVSGSEPSKEGMKGYLLGDEENILIHPKANSQRIDIYLDHDSKDRTTEEFFKLNGLPSKNFRRCYVDDIQGIIEGVALGWGSAIVPRHLLKRNKPLMSRVRVARGYKPLKNPVWLYFYDQPYYTRLETVVIEALVEHSSKFLGA